MSLSKFLNVSSTHKKCNNNNDNHTQETKPFILQQANLSNSPGSTVTIKTEPTNISTPKTPCVFKPQSQTRRTFNPKKTTTNNSNAQYVVDADQRFSSLAEESSSFLSAKSRNVDDFFLAGLLREKITRKYGQIFNGGDATDDSEQWVNPDSLTSSLYDRSFSIFNNDKRKSAVGSNIFPKAESRPPTMGEGVNTKSSSAKYMHDMTPDQHGTNSMKKRKNKSQTTASEMEDDPLYVSSTTRKKKQNIQDTIPSHPRLRELLAPYRRPPVPVDDPCWSSGRDIDFMQWDINYRMQYNGAYIRPNDLDEQSREYSCYSRTLNNNRKIPCVEMFGVDLQGHSVACFVYGFMPFFQVSAPDSWRQRWRKCAWEKKILTDPNQVIPEGSLSDKLLLENPVDPELVGDCDVMLTKLNDALNNLSSMISNQSESLMGLVRKFEKLIDDNGPMPVLGIQPVFRINCYGYNMTDIYLKITMNTPDSIASLRKLFEHGFVWNDTSKDFQFTDKPFAYGAAVTEDQLARYESNLNLGDGLYKLVSFESNIPFVINFMTEMSLMGCSWITIKKGKYKPVQDEPIYSEPRRSFKQPGKRTRCQIEVCCTYQSLLAHDPTDAKWQTIPPLRILTYDIECCGADNRFPLADQDPVICIALYLQVEGGGQYTAGRVNIDPSTGLSTKPTPDSPELAVVLTYGPCEPVPDCIMFEHKTHGLKKDENGNIMGYQWNSRDEAEMLATFRDLIREELDPDAFDGYNIDDFDTPYVYARSQALSDPMNKDQYAGGSVDLEYISKIRAVSMSLRKSVFSSKAYGTREKKELKCAGRISMDNIVILRRDVKDRSYSLNYQAQKILGQTKNDVDHTEIGPGWMGPSATDKTRQRLAIYCLKDAYLPDRIRNFRKHLLTFIEMARATGVPEDWIYTKGAQIKSLSLLLRKARKRGYIIPTFTVDTTVMLDDDDDSYEGAVVVEPKPGFYTDPVTTLDFSSLYPSIIQSQNFCYSTYATQTQIIYYENIWKHQREKQVSELQNQIKQSTEQIRQLTEQISKGQCLDIKDSECQLVKMKEELSSRQVRLSVIQGPAYTRSTQGDDFVKAHLRKGLLPEILDDVIAARKKAKFLMGQAEQQKDESLKDIYNGRQNSLKVVANSIYGFTGARLGRLPMRKVAAAVTGKGRKGIEDTQRLVEQFIIVKFGTIYLEDGKTLRFDIIYGDTDSVMVLLRGLELSRVMELSKEMATFISEYFERPMEILWEKVYWPYILISKKRYAGLLWMNAEKYKQMDKKGIESVRRDNCPYVPFVQNRLLEDLLIRRDARLAFKNVEQAVNDLRTREVGISQLIITKSLSKLPDEYHNPQPHAEVVKKMAKRNEATAPRLGDRVPFVFVCVGQSKDIRGFERTEDPDYVMKHGLPIDYEYYIESQLKKPIRRIIEILQPGITALIFDKILPPFIKTEHTNLDGFVHTIPWQKKIAAHAGIESNNIASTVVGPCNSIVSNITTFPQKPSANKSGVKKKYRAPKIENIAKSLKLIKPSSGSKKQAPLVSTVLCREKALESLTGKKILVPWEEFDTVKHITRPSIQHTELFGVAKWTKAKYTCMNCRSSIQSQALINTIIPAQGGSKNPIPMVFCDVCVRAEGHPMIMAYYNKWAAQFRVHSNHMKTLWTECKKCTHDRFNAIHCANLECDINRKRPETLHRLRSVGTVLDKFIPYKDKMDVKQICTESFVSQDSVRDIEDLVMSDDFWK